jgi:transposase
LFNEVGNEVSVLQTEVDDASFPLGDVTTLMCILILNLPKDQRTKRKKQILAKIDASVLKTHRKYKKEDMEYFFFLVNEKGISVRGAAKHLKIPSNTAFNWKKKSEEAPDEFVELRNAGSGRPVGRPPKLTDAHREYLVKLVDENDTVLTLDQMMESLTTEFMGLQVSKSAFHEFAKTKCRISCKKKSSLSI